MEEFEPPIHYDDSKGLIQLLDDTLTTIFLGPANSIFECFSKEKISLLKHQDDRRRERYLKTTILASASISVAYILQAFIPYTFHPFQNNVLTYLISLHKYF